MAQRYRTRYTNIYGNQPRRKTVSVEEKIHQLHMLPGLGFTSFMAGMIPLTIFFAIINALFKFSNKR